MTHTVVVPAGTPLTLEWKKFSHEIISILEEFSPGIRDDIWAVCKIVSGLVWHSQYYLEDFDLPQEDDNTEDAHVILESEKTLYEINGEISFSS